LGCKIVENMDEDKVAKVLLETDFRDRTVMKNITIYNFSKLLHSYKVNIVLEDLWEGIHTRECDGTLGDFSMLTYLTGSTVRRLPGGHVKASELITNNFVVNIKEEKFWYQFKFR
jgi:hypothetical protein